MWALLRLWHIECLESVIDRPNAVSFVRTSYVAAPGRWRQMAQGDLVARLEHLLVAAYRRRNCTLASSEDPTRMLPFVFDYEWVERGDAPGVPDAIAHPWVLPRANAHPTLIARAFEEIDACLRARRPGIDARAYARTFYAFRIDDDDTWHLITEADRAAMFAERFEQSATGATG